LLVSCRQGGPSAARHDAVNAGVIAIVDVAPIYLGQKKGFFAKRNIDLTLTPGGGAATSIPGVISGQMQFAFGNVTSLLVARDKGLPLKIIANGSSSTGQRGKDMGAVLVPRDSPVQGPRDLAGKTVSVNQLNNIGDTTIRASVRKDGGDPKTIKFVEIAFPDAPAALQDRRVDAIWVVEPFLTRAVDLGARVVAWNFVDTAPGLTIATYFTSEETVAQKPDLTRRFTEALQESSSYAQAHPDEVRDIMKTYTKIPPDVIARITLPDFPARVNRESIKTVADLALADGLLSKPADLEKLLPSP